MAVVLGVVVGIGVNVFPSSIDSARRVNPLQLTPGVQYRVVAYASPWFQLQPVIVGLIAGLVTGVPIFLIVRRRS